MLVILGLCCQERCLPGVTLIATFVNEYRHPRPAQQPCSTCRRDFSRSQSICPVPSAFSFFLPLFVFVFVFLLVVYSYLYWFVVAGRASSRGRSGGCAPVLPISRPHIVVLSCPTYRTLNIILCHAPLLLSFSTVVDTRLFLSTSVPLYTKLIHIYSVHTRSKGCLLILPCTERCQSHGVVIIHLFLEILC